VKVCGELVLYDKIFPVDPADNTPVLNTPAVAVCCAILLKSVKTPVILVGAVTVNEVAVKVIFH